MDVSDASYGVKKTGFKTLTFSDTLQILFESENDIDYAAVKAFLENQPVQSRVDISTYCTLNLKSQTVDLRGYALSDSRYIASKESSTFYSIKNPRSRFHTIDLVARLYHMHITV